MFFFFKKAREEIIWRWPQGARRTPSPSLNSQHVGYGNKDKDPLEECKDCGVSKVQPAAMYYVIKKEDALSVNPQLLILFTVDYTVSPNFTTGES